MTRAVLLDEVVRDEGMSLVLDTGALQSIRSGEDRARDLVTRVRKARRLTTFWNVFEFAEGEGSTEENAKRAREFVAAQVTRIAHIQWERAFKFFCEYRARSRPLNIGDSYVVALALERPGRHVLVTHDSHDFESIDKLLVLDGWGPAA